MKVVQINTFSYKATGTIMMSIHNELLKEGHESYVVWGRGRESNNQTELSIEDTWGIRIHGLITRLFDATGSGSIGATKKLIKFLESVQPDIVHLHNIHGYYINIELLFHYLKTTGTKVVWTLHDCWSITGHCTNFETVECNKWMSGCHSCVQKKEYPGSYLFDNSKYNWKKKKELFTGMDIVIVTPSNWLKKVIERSYLNKNKIVVINNGIDLDIFKPLEAEFRSRYGLSEKKIILGVASEWLKRKGFEDFLQLRELLDASYSIVMVGLNKRQLACLPDGIIGIERTNNVLELVDIYSSADLFLNATYEDIYPTVNMEALACGTPVLTYDTGGAMEAAKLSGFVKTSHGMAFRKSSNSNVDCRVLKETIEELTKEEKNISKCRNAVTESSKEKQNRMYMELYLSIYNGES